MLPPLGPREETQSHAGGESGGPNSDEGTDTLVLRFLFDPWIRNLGSGMDKKRSGSGMNKANHISESLETIFVLRYLNSLMRIWDPGSGMEKIRIRDPGCQKFGSGISIPDPQH
jgi:hypothetical protein